MARHLQLGGIKVEQSRFAALKVDSGPESDEDVSEWHQVGGKQKSRGKNGNPGQTEDSSAPRPISKSAKKRARKKRNQQSASEVSCTCI